jgi:hypothetical protein
VTAILVEPTADRWAPRRVIQVLFRLEEREVALGSNLILMRFDTKQQSTLARRNGTTIFFESWGSFNVP